MNLINLILIALFPGFFIAATAAINLNYLNPLYDKEINEYDYSSFFDDLVKLENINVRFFTIFLPIYLIINYILYYKYIISLYKQKRKSKLSYKVFIKQIFNEKKNNINNNKIIYIIVAIIFRFRGLLLKNIFKNILTKLSVSRSL